MALRDEFERSGNWLYRRRSFLPLLLFAVVLPAFGQYLDGGHTQDLLWEAFCLTVGLAGLCVRIVVIGYAPAGTSGRNTREQVAETLNTSGPYAIVRHPLYLGNYLMWLGLALFARVWWCPVIISLAFWLYYERIMFAEEEFLRRRFGEVWVSWASRTPAFLPALHRWRAPERAFSIQKVLRSEYSALFGLVASFTVLEVLGDVVQDGRLEIDLFWGGMFACAAIAYVVLRSLKRMKKLPGTGRP